MSIHQLVLIDGHALAYRAFFAYPDSFRTRAGEPTNATFGFVRVLLDLILAEEPPQYVAVSFDVGKTFRDDIFPEYKGTREKMPDELSQQIERIKEVVTALNIPILELEGYEADDVLGTIAKQAKGFDVPVKIMTGDRDLLQLVDDNTLVELPAGRGNDEPQLFDAQKVEEKYGVRVEQFVDFKALVGDSSDNIPGVKGVGQVTASKLLEQYETLDGIYEHVEELKGAMKKKVIAGKENAYLSQKLARIVTDAPITFELEDCVARDFDRQEVITLFRELEFRQLTRRLMTSDDDDLPPLPEANVPAPTKTTTVTTSKQLQALVKTLEAATLIAFDVETTSVDKMAADLVGISLAVQEGTGYYIPVGHLEGEAQSESGQMGLFAGIPKLAPNQLPLKTVLDAIRPAMTNPTIGKVAHNAKYDYTVLAQHGLTVTPITFDTMLAEWITMPSSKFLGLKDAARQYLGIEMTPIKDLIGSGKKQISFAQVSVADGAPYAAADADVTLRLMKQIYQARVKTVLAIEKLFHEIELPLVPILADMEQTGIGIDVDFFQQMSADLNERLNQLVVEIQEIAGKPFTLNSPSQLSNVLFHVLNLPHERLRKTKSGYYSTAGDVLHDLIPNDETGIVKLIIEYRELDKLKNTYVDALPQLVNDKTGRIHTSFNQTGSVTGRIASNSPNLQNIPIRTEIGRQIRRGFVARPGWVLLAADYSQVELRVLAHMSQDKALLEAFRQDQDIHRTTAATVYGIPAEEVQFEQRRFAKAVNFGLIYGMGAFRLARDSELTLAEAEDFIKVYFKRFPGIKRYLDGTKALARKQGYVETLLGRRRLFAALQNPNTSGHIVARAEREAINHPIQGTAADIIKIAMLNLHEALSAQYQAKMILQVHDELVLVVPEEEVPAIQPLVETTMSNAYQLDVPLKVESSTGKNWFDLKG